MKSINAKKSNNSFILDGHMFCDILNMFINITFTNNTQLSLFLNIPLSQVEDIRSGRIFGALTKPICFQLDAMFETDSGFFFEVLKKTLIQK